MNYEREDKIALCRATLAIAKADAVADGGTHVVTYTGKVPVTAFDPADITTARDGWIYRHASGGSLKGSVDNYSCTRNRCGLKGYIEERGGNAAFPVLRKAEFQTLKKGEK